MSGMPGVTMPGGNMPSPAMSAEMMKAMEEQTRKNLGLFQDAMKAFNPFLASMSTGMGATPPKTATEKPAAESQAAPAAKSDDFQTLKDQLAAMQQRLETLSQK
jgi:polyhydroxyalkanoate synthesis regulator protein